MLFGIGQRWPDRLFSPRRASKTTSQPKSRPPSRSPARFGPSDESRFIFEFGDRWQSGERASTTNTLARQPTDRTCSHRHYHRRPRRVSAVPPTGVLHRLRSTQRSFAVAVRSAVARDRTRTPTRNYLSQIARRGSRRSARDPRRSHRRRDVARPAATMAHQGRQCGRRRERARAGVGQPPRRDR